MSITYPDLDIKFPDEFDVGEFFRDLTISEKPLAIQWNKLYSEGRFEEAESILAENPKLKECFPTAKDWNRTLEICIGLERFFRDNVQDYVVNAIKFKGEYSPTTQYKVYNLVYYKTTDLEMGTNIDAYVSYKDNVPIGTLPTNKDYFFPVVQRGQMGASGLGIAFRQDWKYDKTYALDDVVSYNNTLWFAKSSNSGRTPESVSSYWGVFLQLKQDTTSVLMVDGRLLSEGLICASFDNPSLIKGTFNTSKHISNGYLDEIRFTDTNKLIADRTETSITGGYNTTIRIYQSNGLTVDKTINIAETRIAEGYKTVIS